jgi:chromosome segregation ATPase
MNIDELTEQFQSVLARARAVLNREIGNARKLVDDLHGERAKAEAEIAQLGDQHKQAQAQLDATLANLQKASNLASLDSDIKKAKAELAALKSETEKASTVLAALGKQRTEADARLVALGNEAQRLIALRTESEAVMASIKTKLQQVQIGNRP